METNIEKEIRSIIDNIITNKSNSDFFISKCRLSSLFQGMSEEEKEKIAKHSDFHTDIFSNVLDNKYFIENFVSFIKKNEKLRQNKEFIALSPEEKRDFIEKNLIEENRVICSALHLAFYEFAYVYVYFSEEKIKYFRNFFEEALFKIKNELNKEAKIDLKISDICLSLYGVVINFNYSYKEAIVIKNFNINKMFSFNAYSRCLMEAMLLIVSQNKALGFEFKSCIRKKKELGEKYSIYASLSQIYSITYKINGGLEHSLNAIKKIGFDHVPFLNYIKNLQDTNEVVNYFIIKRMCFGFKYKENVSFDEIINDKFKEIKKIKQEIKSHVEKNLKAFRGEVLETDNEWSNKIYLISNKVLSTLEAVSYAKDLPWKTKVLKREYNNWITDVHLVLNKEEIEDDWNKIEDCINQENSVIEWKSTFYTPTEQLFISDGAEKAKGRELLHIVAKSMIGMMNTDGGVLLVGVIEKPGAIVRKDITENIIIKNSINFFNVNYELEKKRKSLDDLKREIQDIIFSETGYTAERFNDLWFIEPIEIKSSSKVVVIYKISVKKSEKYIYSVDKKEGAYWLSLIKRADGRTIRVDPRDYFDY